MKRYNNLFEHIVSIENLELADINARKGKSHQPCIKQHDENKEANIYDLHCQLKDKLYTTSFYKTFIIKDPKERVIYRLPYYPDRIVHHAIMNVLEPIFVSTFTSDTYSYIKGRGIHSASVKLKKVLLDVENTRYCLKIDIKKFYPSVNHTTLKNLLRRKFKDLDLLWLLDNIIDSAEGLPIGNYMSQYLANFYLSYFDHWIKEIMGVKHYFRYADDMIFLSGSKEYLHELLSKVKEFLGVHLKLELKPNYQIFPVASRGIDFLGYVFFHGYTRVRKGIKKRFARTMKRSPNKESIASYLGWLKHGNCINLRNKLLYARTA
jgi:RNA-directed DNA polymerase